MTAAASTINIGNMHGVIEEARRALRVQSYDMPSFDDYKVNFPKLIEDLRGAAQNLPPVYQKSIATPFINYLVNRLGEWGFYRAFAEGTQDVAKVRMQSLFADVTMAILIQGQTEYLGEASSAFHEFIADFYGQFVSKEGVSNPSKEMVPPLVKWGNPDVGLYTISAEAGAELGVKASIANLPPSCASGALVSWISLGGKVSGDDLCYSCPDLLRELKDKVEAAVSEQFRSQGLGRYWANCVNEGVADVMGTLHMGPAASLGLIAFFRAMSEEGRLRVIGGVHDSCPIDSLRGFMGAKLVAELAFSQASAWSHLIYAESSKDLVGRAYILVHEDTHQQVSFPVGTITAIQSAYFVASFMANVKLTALRGNSFKEIRCWSDSDQEKADLLERSLSMGDPLSDSYRRSGFSAVHVVAGAIQGAFKIGATPALFQQRMIAYLAQMNRENRLWSGKRKISKLPEIVWERARRISSAWKAMGYQV